MKKKQRLSLATRIWNTIVSRIAFTVVINESYPQRKKKVTTIIHLFPGDNIELSDTKKVICKITCKRFFPPMVIVGFPKLIIDKPKKK